MLVELRLIDLALFEEAEIVLDSGLNAITGETGAGKSLIVGALQLLLGQRARAEVVRTGAKRARVEGRFLLKVDGWGQSVADWLRDNLPEALEEGLGEESNQDELELVLTRTITRDGRSRAHINHRPVTGRVLRELTSQLVEIHGQHEHQRLFDPAEQMLLLDTFGGLEEQLAGYQERRSRWTAALMELDGLEAAETRRQERLDMVQFQLHELENADLEDCDPKALAGERDLLRHAGELAISLDRIVGDLFDDEGSALESVQRSETALEEWNNRLPGLGESLNAVREASAYLELALGDLRGMRDGAQANPPRLEEIEERLAGLDRLARKHSLPSDQLLGKMESLQAERTELEQEGQDGAQLEEQAAKLKKSVAQAAKRLTSERSKAHKRLSQAVVQGLGDLGLARARFEVNLIAHGADGDGHAADLRRFGAKGAESVEFMLAANPGEGIEPLRRVASGGEAARILLALRGALAVRQSTPTLVFDEVDAGVGGRLGPQVAAHLCALSQHHQVIAVTHLPSIAAAASSHLRVVKEVLDGRTRTRAAALTGDDRVKEVADMIAGGSEQETARAEARRLLGQD